MKFPQYLLPLLAGSGAAAVLWFGLNVTTMRGESSSPALAVDLQAQSSALEKPRLMSRPMQAEYADVAPPIDAAATPATRRLHSRLAFLAYRDGFAFGMQGDRRGGVGWVDKPDADGFVPESDLFKVAGVDAGVSGYNVNWLFDALTDAGAGTRWPTIPSRNTTRCGVRP